MPSKQGDLSLLETAAAQTLLRSRNPARLAYTWLDGTPRVVPVWFHWTGEELVICSPTDSPKVKALSRNPAVALTIDDHGEGGTLARVLLVRGSAAVDVVDGVAPEYVEAAKRYLGEEGASGWFQQMGSLGMTQMARVGVRPTWVGTLDFQERFPSALERAMEAVATAR